MADPCRGGLPASMPRERAASPGAGEHHRRHPDPPQLLARGGARRGSGPGAGSSWIRGRRRRWTGAEPARMRGMASMVHTILRIHEAVYKATGGLIGHRVLGGMPTLLLHTTGRRSGVERVNALTYVADDDRWVVVASKGGSDTAPAWLHNLRAEPAVEVQIGRRHTPAVARVMDADDPAYARLWAAANKINHGQYDAYQSKTQRRIPLVVLTPESPGS